MPMSDEARERARERMKEMHRQKKEAKGGEPVKIKGGKPDYIGPRLSVSDRKKRHEQLLNDPFARTQFNVPLAGRMAGWQWRTATQDPEHPNRHYDIVHRLNYEPVTPDDLSCSPESIGFTVNPAGYVVRGPRGEELLVAKPKDEYLAHQMRKAEINSNALKPARNRSEVAQATAKEHGSEAGDAVYDHFTQRDIQEPVPD